MFSVVRGSYSSCQGEPHYTYKYSVQLTYFPTSKPKVDAVAMTTLAPDSGNESKAIILTLMRQREYDRQQM